MLRRHCLTAQGLDQGCLACSRLSYRPCSYIQAQCFQCCRPGVNPKACTCHRQFYLLPLLSLFSALHRQSQDVYFHRLFIEPSAHLQNPQRALHAIRWDPQVIWPTECNGLAGRPDTGIMGRSCIRLQGATSCILRCWGLKARCDDFA